MLNNRFRGIRGLSTHLHRDEQTVKSLNTPTTHALKCTHKYALLYRYHRYTMTFSTILNVSTIGFVHIKIVFVEWWTRIHLYTICDIRNQASSLRPLKSDLSVPVEFTLWAMKMRTVSFVFTSFYTLMVTHSTTGTTKTLFSQVGDLNI